MVLFQFQRVLYKIFKKNVLPVNTDNWHKWKIFVRIDRNMHEKIHTLKFCLVDARKGINTITGTCMRKYTTIVMNIQYYLGEYKHSVTLIFQFSQHFRQKYKFATSFYQCCAFKHSIRQFRSFLQKNKHRTILGTTLLVIK